MQFNAYSSLKRLCGAEAKERSYDIDQFSPRNIENELRRFSLHEHAYVQGVQKLGPSDSNFLHRFKMPKYDLVGKMVQPVPLPTGLVLGSKRDIWETDTRPTDSQVDRCAYILRSI